MNMSKMILAVSLALIVVILSGCVGNTLTGTYTSENNSAVYIKFFNDGTAVGSPDGKSNYSYTYKIDGDTLYVSSMGFTSVAKIADNGKTIIDAEGTKLRKD
jgi:hypothetical protein